MTLICCVDTNALLDICYRYYPNDSFTGLWDGLESAVIAGQVRFIQSEHINKEVERKLAQFDYSRNKYDDFMRRLKVDVIRNSDYAQALISLKGDLASNVPFIARKQGTFLDNLDEDLSNISVASIKNAKVITSEQGFNTDITNPVLRKSTQLKIPDVCRYKHIPCSNWLDVFTHLGMRF
jgi:hypothetical protein